MKKKKKPKHSFDVINENWSSCVSIFVNYEPEEFIEYIKPQVTKDPEELWPVIHKNNEGLAFTNINKEGKTINCIYMRKFDWLLKDLAVLGHEIVHYTEFMLKDKGTGTFDGETFAYAFEHTYYKALQELGKKYGNRSK